jgi:hypothetical protein
VACWKARKAADFVKICTLTPFSASVSTFRPGSQHSKRSKSALPNRNSDLASILAPKSGLQKKSKNNLFRSDTTDPEAAQALFIKPVYPGAFTDPIFLNSK